MIWSNMRGFVLANKSLKQDIYAYLNAQSSLTALLDTGGIGWGQMPDTAVTKRMIVYSMLSDVRIDDDHSISTFRNQRWRFWICFPKTGTAPKDSALDCGNVLLDVLNNISGTFGSTTVQYIVNDSNSDPFFDTASNCYIVIQDYKIKMRTLE